MTGLEKIVEQIRQEAQSASEEKLAQTRKEAEQILAEEKKKREVSYDMAMKQIEADTRQLLLRGQSAADLEERKMILEAKLQIIQQIFEEAIDRMLHLSAKEYFTLLLHMVDRYAFKENGILHLCQKDLDRMTDSFESELRNRQITISQEPVQVSGGFLLSYGEVEENCSFEELLAANREHLQDQIVAIIF